MHLLDSMLAQSSRADFFAESWERAPLVLRGGAAELARYVTLEQLPAMVKAALVAKRLRPISVSENGRMCYRRLGALEAAAERDELTIEAINTICGPATLVVNAVHLYDNGADRMLRALFNEFAERMTLNLYYSPNPGQPGLGMHYDRWEIFAAHLRGAKRWQIWAPTIQYPVDDRTEDGAGLVDTPPQLDTIVEGGDILYLPRGSWHLAEPTPEPSLHLTIGVHAKKGVDVAHWLLAEASQQAALRRNFPHTQTGDEAGQLAGATEAIAALREVVGDKRALQRFLRFQFAREYAETFGPTAPKDS